MFARSRPPQTMSAGQASLPSRGVKSSRRMEEVRAMTSRLEKPMPPKALRGIRWNTADCTPSSSRGILYCGAMSASARTRCGRSRA